MNDEKVRWAIGVICLLLVGCASTPAGSNVPDISSEPPLATETTVSTEDVRTATAWARHRAAQTLAAQETAMPAPTQTPSPVPTPVPPSTPWGSLSPSGPWLVGRSLNLIGGEDGYLWAANPDLSGLTRLIPEPVIAYAIRPMDTIASGLTIAYATRSCAECIDITLKMVTLPGGEIKTIVSLYPAAQGSDFSDHFRMFMNALTDGGLVWSPDGRTLAFVSTLSDFSVAVYTYNLDTGQITQLSDGLLWASRLEWSPDGRYVIYEGNSIGGSSSQVVRSVPVGGGPNISLTDESHVLHLVRYGWQSPTQILLGANYFEEQGSILSVNVATGDSEVIAHASQFHRGAYSENYQAWLLTRYGPDEPLDPALLLCRGGNCQAVSSERLSWVWWSSSYDVFLGLSEQSELYQITPGGAVSRLPVKLEAEGYPEIPIVVESPDGTRWAWHSWELTRSGSTSVYLGDPLAQPRVLVSFREMQMHKVAWSPDSQHLLMFDGTNTYIASQPNFEPILAIQGWTATDITWVK